MYTVLYNVCVCFLLQQLAELSFAIVLESSQPDEEQQFYFTCSNDKEFFMWEDGINSLLNIQV